MASVTVRDETATGREIDSWVLAGLPETISARDLVRLPLRVREEVAQHNLAASAGVPTRPAAAGVARDAEPPAPPRHLDWVRHADRACAAFARNGFPLLVGERQIDDLDEQIDLRTGAEVCFVRLVPLAGG
ncbi:hypothetical protein V6U90_04065 [Micromonospora sp. CPCC 206060]|uniref:hypothetical protein n=1 Tax=Micromonospora sp. CPCC 206060 TaxID=3122406 RepID=UPI002FF16457